MSDDLKHDQCFVSNVVENMVAEVNISAEMTLLIVSDNCPGQYKSVQNFFDMQNLCNKHGVRIVRVYGIPGHGKNEIDCVGEVVKIALRRAVTVGEFFPSAACCIDYLNEKFGESISPRYIKEIYTEELSKRRASAKYVKYGKVAGSSRFRVMVFTPNEDVKAAPYLCICHKCMNSYGSCQLFTSHPLVNFAINQTFLRSHESLHDEINDDDNDLDIDTDYFTEGTICAVPSDKESPDPFYFVKIEGEAIVKFDMMDDYNNLIKIDQHYILGHYLEK